MTETSRPHAGPPSSPDVPPKGVNQEPSSSAAAATKASPFTLLNPSRWVSHGTGNKAAGLRFRWYESWIIRAAFMASIILFLGFSVSGFLTYSSIDSIANMAHDPEVEKSLEAHLDSLKKIHELQQKILVSRLQAALSSLPERVESSGDRVLSGSLLENLLQEHTKDLDMGADPWTLARDQSTAQNLTAQPMSPKSVRWISREELQVESFVVHFSRTPVYEMFKKTEDLKQRYQLVGLKLHGQIIPSLMKASVVVLLISFFVLVSLFFAYARTFKAEINDVIEGFTVWSEKDVHFRFGNSYPGELRLITNHFNEMADEVESNRKKTLYLEKIASWQIIARKLAHEIKNPLTPIQMMVSQLKRRYKGDDPAFGKLLDEAQQIITEEVASLRRMVDSFSQFARLPEPTPKKTDLVPLCHHVLELQKNIFNHIHFVLHTPSKHMIAEIDEDLVRQVILNIVKNAGEACLHAQAAISITLAETPLDVIIAIHDNGDGIPQEVLSRIFEAYFTTKHTGPTPGMGLGLAVCQKIVMDHRGTMNVHSTKGSTTFTVRLPKKWKPHMLPRLQ